MLPGMSLNYPEINTESFLISLTSLLFSHFSSSLLSFLFIVRSSLYSFPPGHEFNRSRNEHRIISEFLFLSLVKVFFLFLGFVFYFSLYFDLQLQAVVYLHVIENLYITVMTLVGFSTSAV